MTSYYRIQDTSYAPSDLLLPENQLSYNWSNAEDVRTGVSACESVEELATYLAQSGIPFGTGDWVLVEMAGHAADSDDADAHLGAVLCHPTAIVSTIALDDDFYDLVGAAFDTLAA